MVGELDETVRLRIDVGRLADDFTATDGAHLPEHGHH